MPIQPKLLVVAAVTFVAGCASNQPAQPPDGLVRAEASIEQAERAGAQRAAARELNLARQKLDEARDAYEEEDLTAARRLAEQAIVDAEYAAAKAGNEEMQAAVQELRSGLQTLREETRETAPQPR